MSNDPGYGTCQYSNDISDVFNFLFLIIYTKFSMSCCETRINVTFVFSVKINNSLYLLTNHIPKDCKILHCLV